MTLGVVTFSFNFSIKPKKVELLKTWKVMHLFWKSIIACKTGKEEENTFFKSVLIKKCQVL